MRVLVDIIEKGKGGDSSNSNHAPVKRFIEVHPNQTIWMLKTFVFGALNHITPARQQAYIKIHDESDPRGKTQAYLKELHNYRLVKDYRIQDGDEIQIEVLEKEVATDFLVAPKQHQQQLQQLQQQDGSNGNAVSPTLGRTVSVVNPPVQPSSANTKVKVLSAKKIACPALCFALGKGLYRGISGSKYEIKLYRVNAKGVLITTTTSHSPFQIDIVKLRSSVDARMPFQYDQRKADQFSTLTLSPQSYGDYSISIKIDDTHICGSPFLCTIIDELNPKIKELAFSNEWVEEIVELITMMSKKESTLDNLFSFGIEGLINLSAYPDPTIQIHITGVLARLLEKDRNKERVLKEYGTEIFFKIVSLETWISFMELRKFLASSLSILISSKQFLNRFFDQCNIDIILVLAKSDSIDIIRSCSIVLCQLSENYDYAERLMMDEIKELLVSLIQSKDSITKNCALRAISNLSQSIDTKRESNIKVLQCLLDCCRTSDISFKVLIFKSFSNFCRYESLCIYLLNNGILDLISTNDPCAYYEMPMYFQWEHNVKQLLASDQNAIEYSLSYMQIFKEESDLTFFLSLTIANMLYTSSSLKIHERFSNGNGLALIKQFVLCHNCSARVESFRCFMLISNSSHDLCKRNLIQNGLVSFLMSLLVDSTNVEIPFIINTIANLCDFDPSCVESIGENGIEKLIHLLVVDKLTDTPLMHSGGSGGGNNHHSTHFPICLILANIACVNEKYKEKIVNGGGKIFLQHLLDLVKQRKICVLKQIAPNDVSNITEIGRGVSGIVTKSQWNGHVVAVKTYNEDSLGFDEKQFHIEATITSILEHENIVHCIGGNKTPGKMFLVSDFMSRGSLYDVIHAREIPLSTFKTVHILLQTAKGMEYLHKLGVIHRDLKSGNVLLDQDWNVRICDFGVSRVVDPRRMTKGAGTPCNMAVEVLKGGTEYGLKADVYSFGMVIWECVARAIPYGDMAQIDWIRSVLEEGYRLPIPQSTPVVLEQLIRRCWDSNPEVRPTFVQLVQELTTLRDDIVASGVYEDLASTNIAPPVQTRNYRYSTYLNENKISMDFSTHPTEVLKPLVEDTPAIASTYGESKSMPNSPLDTPASSPENRSTSPPPQRAISPPTPQSWKRSDSSQIEKPSNRKRISAFRTLTKQDLANMTSNSSSPDSSSTSPHSPLNVNSIVIDDTTEITLQSESIPITVNNNNNQDNGDNSGSVNGGVENIIMSPNTFSSQFSNLTSDTSGLLTSSTNSLSSNTGTTVGTFSDPYSVSFADDHSHSHHHQSHHSGHHSSRSHNIDPMFDTKSTKSSRSNSTVSQSESFHPNFNPNEFEDFLSPDKSVDNNSNNNTNNNINNSNQINSVQHLVNIHHGYSNNHSNSINLKKPTVLSPPKSILATTPPSNNIHLHQNNNNNNNNNSVGVKSPITIKKAPVLKKAPIVSSSPSSPPLSSKPTTINNQLSSPRGTPPTISTSPISAKSPSTNQ